MTNPLEALTAAEKKELEAWKKLPFLILEPHRKLKYQIVLCFNGVEHGIVVGPLGTGKSFTIEQYIKLLRAGEAEAVIADPEYQPRSIVDMVSSDADGKKTVLSDLYAEVFGVSASDARFHTPRTLVELLAEEFRIRNTRLLCIDEAQKISPDNLDLLRQVPDECNRLDHPLSLVLVGNESLRDNVVEIRQLGQRFSFEIEFPRFSATTVHEHLLGFHPHLARLKSKMPKAEWRRLEADMLRASNGSFRRMFILLSNSNSLALAKGIHINEEVIRAGISKLAPEN